jgi:hypothetical protein
MVKAPAIGQRSLRTESSVIGSCTGGVGARPRPTPEPC